MAEATGAIRRSCLVLAVAVAWLAPACLAQVPPVESRPPKRVTGHQMSVLNMHGAQQTPEQYREQVAFWEDLGLTNINIFDISTESMRRTVLAYHAASVALDSPVKMNLSLHGHGMQGPRDPEPGQPWSAWVSLLHTLTHDPAYASGRTLVNGKYYLSGYWSGPQLGDFVTHPSVVAAVGGESFIESATVNPFRSEEQLAAVMTSPAYRHWDGFSQFDFTRSITAQADLSRTLVRTAHAHGRTARPQIIGHYIQMGSGVAYEGWGFRRLAATWRAAIDEDADAVEFITLNDVKERTYINAWRSDDPPVLVNWWDQVNTGTVLSHEGWREFSRRCIAWFKHGEAPPIDADELYVDYRLHPRDAESYANLRASEQQALARWFPPGVRPHGIYRKEAVAGHANHLSWRNLSDGVHLAVRLIDEAEILVDGRVIGRYDAGEHLIAVPGSRTLDTSEADGYPLHVFGPEDMRTPLVEIRRSGVAVVQYRGEAPITPWCAPGNWNTLNRKAVANRLTCMLTGVHEGQNVYGDIALSATWGGDARVFDRLAFYAGDTLIGETSREPYEVVWSSPPQGVHHLTVRVCRRDGTYASSDPIRVIVQSPGVALQHRAGLMCVQDIGAVAEAGTVRYDTSRNTLALTTRGRTDPAADDEITFAWLRVSGDFRIVTRIASLDGGGAGARAGLMVRDKLTDTSRHVELAARADDRYSFGWRFFEAAQSDTEKLRTGLTFPDKWLRLTRRGHQFEFEHSPDGRQWTLQREGINLPLGTTVYVGLFAASLSAGERCTAVLADFALDQTPLPPSLVVDFAQQGWSVPVGRSQLTIHATMKEPAAVSEVGLTVNGRSIGPASTTRRYDTVTDFDWTPTAPGAYAIQAVAQLHGQGRVHSNTVPYFVRPTVTRGLPAGWFTRDIGEVWNEGRTGVVNGRWTVVGGGRDVYRAHDGLRYAWREMAGDFTAVCRVASLKRTSDYANAGLMVRASDAADARGVFVAMTPTQGVRLGARRVDGVHTEQDQYVKTPTAPGYLRLERRGDEIIASHSRDGAAWTAIGRTRIDLPDTALVGLYVSSNNITIGSAGLCEAVFDHVTIDGVTGP